MDHQGAALPAAQNKAAPRSSADEPNLCEFLQVSIYPNGAPDTEIILTIPSVVETLWGNCGDFAEV